MYAIMDLWPQDAHRDMIEWTTVSVHDTENEAKVYAKPGQIVVPYDADRWWNAEKAWANQHRKLDEELLG